MAASITIRDYASPKLAELAAGLDPAKLNARIAPAVQRLIFDHLASKEQDGNKAGWPSTHFWAQCARSTQWRADASRAIVSINQLGFRQRLMGGDIFPVEKKMLAIPARSEAYGKRAEEFGNLHVIFGKRKDGSVGPVALAAGEGGATRKVFGNREASGNERPVPGADEGVVMFWLVKSVHQDADPSALPTEEQIIAAAVEATEAYIRLLERRTGSAGAN